MKIALLIAAGFFFIFGAIDFIGSFTGFDLWGSIGIYLPDIIWQYSAYIEMLAGYLLFKAARSNNSAESQA